MIEFLALWRQTMRCRRGDHAWEIAYIAERSNVMECMFCPAVGYEIKETTV